MNNLEEYARKELELAGLFRKDSFYRGMLGDAVMELVRVFSAQEHSGLSAKVVISLFERVARLEPLVPLTGEPDEWNEVGTGVFQNRRCSHIFKENGVAYDFEGKIFKDRNGATYISSDSRVPVVFPCIPKSEIVEAGDRDGN